MAKYVNEANLQRFWDNIQGEIGSASQAQVDAWLNEHPEATTTVQDGAITTDKLADGSVTDAKLVQDGGVLSEVARLDDLLYGIDGHSLPVNWFKRGNMSSGDDSDYRAGSRVITKNILEFDTDSVFTVTSGQFFLNYYDSNDAYTGWTNWKTSSNSVFIPKGQRFRILLTLNNSASASQVDAIDDIVSIGVLKVDALVPHAKHPLGIEFEHGNISNGADGAFNAAARARTVGVVQLPYSAYVSMSNGSYAINALDENGAFLYATAWRGTEKYLIPANQRFRLVLTFDTSSSDAADLHALVDALDIAPAGCANSFPAVTVYCDCGRLWLSVRQRGPDATDDYSPSALLLGATSPVGVALDRNNAPVLHGLDDAYVVTTTVIVPVKRYGVALP